MTELSFRAPARAFGGTEVAAAMAPKAARAVVIPFPLEVTASYGGGTSQGPEAIIAASPQLEFFDAALWREPYRDFGIATLEAPAPLQPLTAALDQIERLVEAVLGQDKFPLVLGGEHALTAGAVRPLAARHEDLVVLHLDAHLDLRDGYLGEKFSHAAAMRRVLELGQVRVVSVGVRNVSAEEAAFLDRDGERVAVHWARERAEWDLAAMVAPLTDKPVYVSFDLDALDASAMPATGTPEPGGLTFDEACAVLRAAAAAGRIVGGDVVELAPIPGLHACDFTAAKLAYTLLSVALAADCRR